MAPMPGAMVVGREVQGMVDPYILASAPILAISQNG